MHGVYSILVDYEPGDNLKDCQEGVEDFLNETGDSNNWWAHIGVLTSDGRTLGGENGNAEDIRVQTLDEILEEWAHVPLADADFQFENPSLELDTMDRSEIIEFINSDEALQAAIRMNRLGLYSIKKKTEVLYSARTIAGNYLYPFAPFGMMDFYNWRCFDQRSYVTGEWPDHWAIVFVDIHT